MTSSSDSVLVDNASAGVMIITLNRPDTMNAFSGEMGEAIQAALWSADRDDSVRAVVVTGAGRAFCAGADFSGGAAVFGAPVKKSFSADPFDYHPWDVRKPVIAAINGHAVGLGMTMALQCDIRFVARDAKYAQLRLPSGEIRNVDTYFFLSSTPQAAKSQTTSRRHTSM